MNAELPAERLNELAADALEISRRCSNLAQFHYSRGETREAIYAEQAQHSSRRYAEILTERADAAVKAQAAGA